MGTRSATFRKIVEGAFHAVLSVVKTVWNWIKGHWILLAGILLAPFAPLIAGAYALYKLVGIVAHVFDSIKKAITGGFDSWWAGHGKEIEEVWHAVWSAISAVFKALWDPMADQVRAGWDAISDVFKAGMAVATTIFRVGWGYISAASRAVWDLISGVVKAAWAVISGVVQVAVAGITALIKADWDVIVGIFNVALDLVTGHWGKAWDDIKNTVTQVWNAIKGFLTAAWHDDRVHRGRRVERADRRGEVGWVRPDRLREADPRHDPRRPRRRRPPAVERGRARSSRG